MDRPLLAADGLSSVMASTPQLSLVMLSKSLQQEDQRSRGRGLAPSRLYTFDMLRAVAALLVFLSHFWGILGGLPASWNGFRAVRDFFLHCGGTGTDTLLYLCGFFLAHSLNSSRFAYFPYVKHRLLVIYGPYVCVLSAAVGVSLVSPGLSKFGAGIEPIPYVLQQLLLFPGLFPAKPMLTVAWTLAYIVAAYLLCPLWHWPVRKAGWGMQAAFWFASMLGVLAGVKAWSLPPRILLLLAGMSAYAAARWVQPHLAGTAWPRLLGSAGALLGGYLLWALGSGQSVYSVELYLSEAISLSVLAVAFLSGAGGAMPSSLGPLKRFGEAGYSFYLLHGSVTKVTLLLLLPSLGWRINGAAAVAAGLAASFLLATVGSQVLYRLVEVPLRRAGSWTSKLPLQEPASEGAPGSLPQPEPLPYSRADAKCR